MKNLLILGFAFLALPLAGQNKRPQRDSIKQAHLEILNEYRLELFKSELGLTDVEVGKVMQIYNPYLKEVNQLKRSFRKKWRKRDKSQYTEAEANAYLIDVFALRTNELELLKKVCNDLKPILPTSKIILLTDLEKEIKRKLIKKARELKNEIDTKD
jgi:hypothetical protein